MKGLAPEHTLTGQVQRAIADDWLSASSVMARLGLPPKQYRTVQALLERLVKEGRAVKADDGTYTTLREQQGSDGTEPSFASAALGAPDFRATSEVGRGDDGETHPSTGVPGESRSPSPASEGVTLAAEGAPSGQLVLEVPAEHMYRRDAA